MSEVTFGDNLSRKLDSHLAKTIKNGEFFVNSEKYQQPPAQAGRLTPHPHPSPPAVCPHTARAGSPPAALSMLGPKVTVLDPS